MRVTTEVEVLENDIVTLRGEIHGYMCEIDFVTVRLEKKPTENGEYDAGNPGLSPGMPKNMRSLTHSHLTPKDGVVLGDVVPDWARIVVVVEALSRCAQASLADHKSARAPRRAPRCASAVSCRCVRSAGWRRTGRLSATLRPKIRFLSLTMPPHGNLRGDSPPKSLRLQGMGELWPLVHWAAGRGLHPTSPGVPTILPYTLADLRK
jgi:hypothetical protein